MSKKKSEQVEQVASEAVDFWEKYESGFKDGHAYCIKRIQKIALESKNSGYVSMVNDLIAKVNEAQS